MITLIKNGAWLLDGSRLVAGSDDPRELPAPGLSREDAAKGTMAYGILKAHNTSGDMGRLKLRFDALTSHDITYVGIIQTARASGLDEFPMPYVLTNCHNSLCAVGGTINEDDHRFGLSAAKRYGGIYVPEHLAVIHQFMREMQSGCGKMILGSDSHTRYGALGTMAVGEGGPELVKQLLGRTWDNDMPEVVAVYLSGEPAPGVGPQDVALAIIGAVFSDGFVKNRVMEFVGPGVSKLSADYRIGIDVMTTETACLTSIWQTDDVIKEYYEIHGRAGDYRKLEPASVAYYDRAIAVDLSRVKSMIALPFHPSNVYSIEDVCADAGDILATVEAKAREQFGQRVSLTLRDKLSDGRLNVQQGVIAGCAGGGFENITAAADILRGCALGCDTFSLSIYPASQPINLALTRGGVMADLMSAGAIIRTAFCGPCFGAGDTPANNELSLRHSTRNFPNREGSKPNEGQISAVALMDARSIAATAARGGRLTAATELDVEYSKPEYRFDRAVYDNRCWFGYGEPQRDVKLQLGPNITDWPAMQPLAENLLLQAASVIMDPVTTTDELIPSGETSSLRSNPLRLAEFTLSRRDPGYVARAKAVQALEQVRLSGRETVSDELRAAMATAAELAEGATYANTALGSVVFANRPGDGSAREQAASCQKVLGTLANIAHEYATKRYRSNLINWGMLPFILEEEPCFGVGDLLFIPGVRAAVRDRVEAIPAYVLGTGTARKITLRLSGLTDEEREIILTGCLINHYRDEARAGR